MSLYFENNYSDTATISICVLYYDDSCPNPWRKAGWYNAGPGESVQVWSGSLNAPQLSENWYYFAYASDGASWAGEDISVRGTRPSRFDQCWLESTPDSETFGLRHVDVGQLDNFTIRLAGDQRSSERTTVHGRRVPKDNEDDSEYVDSI